MNPLAIIFTLLTGYYLLKLPRTWAPLPLLIGASYMTLGQSISIGPFHFYVIRILITLGAIRVMFREEHLAGGWQSLDRMMLLWCGCAVLSSFFHESFSAALINRLGFAFDALGLYFLLRIFIRDSENIMSLLKILLIVLAPIAIEMVMETATGNNLFSFLGGVPAMSEVRNGHVRAQGPFGHSILAGTVGAVCLPLTFLFWKNHRSLALLGLATTGAMVLSSRSSGPIMTVLMACLGLCLWKVREHLRLIRWAVVLGVITLALAMNAPVCYVLARIDLTGSSTGWHRAALIDSAFKHLDEWWLGGTDYTRHWMPTGVGWSGDHTDMTNYYLKLGVLGGLPLMLLFIGVLACGFNSLGRVFRLNDDLSSDKQFLLWTLGAVLFGHVATMVSVSYFDQSIVFLYLILASIGSVQTSSVLEPELIMAPSICHE